VGATGKIWRDLPKLQPFYRADHLQEGTQNAIWRFKRPKFGSVNERLDASHGHERAHIDSFVAVGELLIAYLQSPPVDLS
jgi:hypothetical protein